MLLSMIPVFTIRTTHTTRTMDFNAFFSLLHGHLYTHTAVLSSGMEILVWDLMVHMGSATRAARLSVLHYVVVLG